MTRKEYFSLAQRMAQSLDEDAIRLFADAMEEMGDVRAAAVRHHSHCCTRGLIIVQSIARFQTFFTEFQPCWDNSGPSGVWPCNS